MSEIYFMSCPTPLSDLELCPYIKPESLSSSAISCEAQAVPKSTIDEENSGRPDGKHRMRCIIPAS